MNLNFTVLTRQRYFLYGPQIRFFMRVTLVYIILLTSTIQFLRADSALGQGLNTRITIEMKNESLETLFKKITKKTGLSIVYTDVDKFERISLPEGERTVKEILDLVLGERPLDYSFKNNRVVIYKVEDEEGGLDEVIVPMIEKEEVVNVFTVTGKVTNVKGDPMPGVNIIVKGTANGTTTDVEGKFAIDANNNDVLVFSFIGFKTYETHVSGRSVIDASLEEDIKSLEEVEVNAGYWQVTDKERTGNIARITGDDIQKQPVTNPLQAMQGRMAGVYITQSSGLPGSGLDIRIRGQNSLRNSNLDNGNLPLYVVDGVPIPSSSLSYRNFTSVTNYGNPLSSINPYDIESIEVLKDADATAIYGSRGANGVVLITTKKGQAGKTSFDVNFYQGVGQVPSQMDLLNTGQYIEMRREAFRNDMATPQSWDYDLAFDSTRSTDWQEELLGGTSDISNAQTSISGGNENTQFLIGGGYYRETSVFPSSFLYERISSHFNVNHSTINKRLNISLTANYLIDDNDLPNIDPTLAALTMPPNAPALKDENGNFTWEDTNTQNPLASLQKKYVVKTNNFISNLLISYKILPELNVKCSFGYNMMDSDEIRTSPITSNNPAFGVTQGSSRFSEGRSNTWIIEPQVEYTKEFLNGKLSVLFGTALQHSVSEGLAISANGFPNDNSLENIAAATSIRVSGYNYSQYRYNAIFSRINYNWKEKFVINLTARRDGSSRFGAGKQYGNFGAAGLAWIFSNEQFIKNNLAFVSFGKLRSSYGITGSDQISDYGYLDSYLYTGDSYLGIPTLRPSRIANADYSWESNKKFEGAIELGFANNRIYFSASFFRNRSSNQLVGFPLPAITGFTSIQSNLPATVENRGWEFNVTTRNIDNDIFQWSTIINLTIPNNDLIEFPGIENSAYANTYQVGKSLYVRKSFLSTGVHPQTGSYTFKDVNADESITYLEDRLFVKEVSQQFFGGIQNQISYKDFTLDLLFQFVRQTGRNYLSSFSMPGMYGNQPVDVMSRWQGSGDVAGIQMFTQEFDSNFEAWYNYTSSDRSITDASFIRLKNISLSWDLPDKWHERLKMKGCRLYVQSQNLMTISGYNGVDPESQSFSSIPPLRTLIFGFKIMI